MSLANFSGVIDILDFFKDNYKFAELISVNVGNNAVEITIEIKTDKDSIKNTYKLPFSDLENEANWNTDLEQFEENYLYCQF